MKTRSTTPIPNKNLPKMPKASSRANGNKKSRTAKDSTESVPGPTDIKVTSACPSAPVSSSSDADIECDPIFDEITAGAADYDSNAETESDSDEPRMLSSNSKKKSKPMKKKAKKLMYDDNIDGICIAPRSSPVITDQMEQEVIVALSSPPAKQFFGKNSKVVTAKLLQLYQPEEWLEDEAVDLYLALIGERNNSGSDPTLPKIFSFPSYFFVMLNRVGYESVRDFTDGTNIFDFDILFVPIATGKHWRLIAIDFKTRSIMAYDSLNRKSAAVLEKLKNYLRSEYNKLVESYGASHGVSVKIRRMLFGECDANAITGGDYSESSDTGYTETSTQLQSETFLKDWVIDNAKKENVPQQYNEHDCGVFLCQYAESLARRIPPPFDFDQQNMAHFRVLMAFETLSGELVPRCASGTLLCVD